MRVVAAAAETTTARDKTLVEQELREQEIQQAQPLSVANEILSRGKLEQIEVISVRDFLRHSKVLSEQIAEFQPDWVLVSSEDLSHTLLREAARAAQERLVYVAHTPQWYPFGPASWNPDDQGAAIVREAAAVVAISQSMAKYIEQHLGRKAAVVHPPMYGAGPYEKLARFDGAIAMINPCAVKGISIFLALADLFPDQPFAALPGWGTTPEDLEQLGARPNITISPRVKRIEQFLEKTKILLMPSLWLEGFGLIVMEAMLHGVPVIASNSGGLTEAKAGTNFVIPVHRVEQFQGTFDERHMPKPVLPPQNLEPWAEALRTLLSDRARWEQEVELHQQAALRFVGTLDHYGIVSFLESLPKPAVPGAPASVTGVESAVGLSDAKRALLLKRLREKSGKRESQ